jgi:phosphoribosylamine--glycine ligase
MDYMESVLIVGGGGREHALLKALLRSDRPLFIHAYPGNPGMENDGCTLLNKKMNDWNELAEWAKKNEIDLTIVGPEVPLVEGIVDVFKKKGRVIFGPNKKAARIEGDKSFSKKFMKKHGIPTAAFAVFDNKESAISYVKKQGAPIVVKASGLAAGKGVIVCETVKQATDALGAIFDDKMFGDAGSTVVIAMENRIKFCRFHRITNASATTTQVPIPAAWALTRPVRLSIKKCLLESKKKLLFPLSTA